MSKPILKNFLPLFLLSFLTFSAFSQEVKSKSEITKDWQNLETREGINFQVRKDECAVIEGQKPLIYTFLKLTNETNVDKMVHFNFGLQFQEGCDGCNAESEFIVDILVPANSQIESNCTIKNQSLSRMITNPNLSGGWKFENILLTDLNIE